MLLITQITGDPQQTMTLTLPNGNTVGIQLYYSQNQMGWFVITLTYLSFTLNGFRITNNPNLLMPWQDIIPFGLACFTTGNREPTQQQDFASGASQLYIVTQAEVSQYNTFLSSGSF
jgi:hypothetical protein